MVCFFAFLGVYLGFTLAAALAARRLPRSPVVDVPDWGSLEDFCLTAKDGGRLETWKVLPEGKPRGVAVLAHGWSRNRDRMTPRARVFGRMGYTCLMASARDHGGSSPYARASALSFAEDIETVLEYAGQPVILYGHSAGAGGAMIAAARNPEKIRLLILEGCYLHTRSALFHLYWDIHPLAGILLAPGIVFWSEVFYGFGLNSVSPVRLAKEISVPVLIIHGDKDEKFPVRWARVFRKSFGPDQARVYIAKGRGHSDSPDDPGFGDALETFVTQHGKPDA